MGKLCKNKFCATLNNPLPFNPNNSTAKFFNPVPLPVIPAFGNVSTYTPIYFGKKRYELSDWLGNVRVVINDRKTPINSGNATLGYKAQVVSVTDYYSFGGEIAERTYEVVKPLYRFGFQAQEKDNEIYGKGNTYYFKFREHDARIGRFWSVDPLARKYPHNSPYAFAENRVIDGVELEGLEWSSSGKYFNYMTGRTEVQYTVKIKVTDAQGVVVQGYKNYVEQGLKPMVEDIFNNQKTKGMYEDPDIKMNIVVDDKATIELRFVEKLEKSTANADSWLGNTQKNEIRMSLKNINKGLNESPWRTLAHELGHTAGLEHPWEIEDINSPQKDIKQPNTKKLEDVPVNMRMPILKNLMNSGENPVKELKSTKGEELTEGQRKTIEQNVRKER